jgi:elongation factor P hydroxylase
VKAQRALSDRQIAGCFNTHFAHDHNVRLVGGARDPEYLPGTGLSPAFIRYTRDYARSALHELAHWCIAGPRRRGLPDYGYWYVPAPRSAAEREAFEVAETRVQALESILADAAGVPFGVSVDDIENVLCREEGFSRRVDDATRGWRRRGLPGRAYRLAAILGRHALPRLAGR